MIRSYIGYLLFSSQVGGRERHKGKDNNIQNGFMRMPENLMDAEVMGMDYWHMSQLQGDALYWPCKTCLGWDRTPVAEGVNFTDEPELRLLAAQSM